MAVSLGSDKPSKAFSSFLLALAACISAGHFALAWKADLTGLLGLSLLSEMTIGSLLWEKRYRLRLQASLLSRVAGYSILLALVAWGSIALTGKTSLFLVPVIAGFGLALIASGIRGLKQFRQELLILCALSLPLPFLTWLNSIYPLTIKLTGYVSAFMLHYFGFTSSFQDDVIVVQSGSVLVGPGCSGTYFMSYMLILAVLCLVLFPVARKQQKLVLVVAVSLGFMTNCVRVAMLALTSSHQEVFDMLHKGVTFQWFWNGCYGDLWLVLSLSHAAV